LKRALIFFNEIYGIEINSALNTVRTYFYIRQHRVILLIIISFLRQS